MIKKRTIVFILFNYIIVFLFLHLLSYKEDSFSEIGIPQQLTLSVIFILLYGITGSFNQVIRKSRFKEFIRTFNQSLLIGIIYFLYQLIIEKKLVGDQQLFTLIRLMTYHLAWIFFFRLFYLTIIKRLLQRRQIGFKTLIIGQSKKANSIYHEINQQKKSLGFKFEGYVSLDQQEKQILNSYLPHLGDTKNLNKIIEIHEIEEVIIAIEPYQHPQLDAILSQLEKTEIIVNMIPDLYDIISGSVKANYLFAIPLITLHTDPMPFWQKIIKVLFDYIVSFLILIIFSPLILLISILIKATSKGPIIYSQERIGLKGKPFMIHKFRSMVHHAEIDGPQLSKTNDNRITKVGLILRKYRLDELPQFFNVIKGEMSIVGPRPERQFYIDQIIKTAPHYYYLNKVLPGITSWGQVKFGYAENIDQMIKRLTFDIIYIENRSLSLDFKILIYTIFIILQRRGK